MSDQVTVVIMSQRHSWYYISTCASNFYFLKSINGFLSFTSFIITFSMDQHYKTAGVN